MQTSATMHSLIKKEHPGPRYLALGDDSANNRNCFSSLYCSCDKIPSRKQLEGGRDGYGRRFERTQSVMMGKVWWQGQKAAGRAGSAVGKLKERFRSSAGSLLSLFIPSAIPGHKIVLLTSRVVFPSSVKPPENTSIDIQRCIPMVILNLIKVTMKTSHLGSAIWNSHVRHNPDSAV